MHSDGEIDFSTQPRAQLADAHAKSDEQASRPTNARVRWKELLSPRGRTSRKHYWMFFLAFWSIAYLNAWQARALEGPDLSTWIQVLTLAPVLVVLSRRLHDIGLSGWWALLYFAPAIAFGAAQRMDLMHYAGLIKMVMFVILGLIPGVSRHRAAGGRR